MLNKPVLLFVFLVFFIKGYSQDSRNYLFGEDKEIEWSIFLAPEVKYSKLFDVGTVYGGIKGGLLYNNRFTAGLSAGAFLTEALTEGPGSDGYITGLNQVMGYGGLYFDYNTSFNSPLQISFPTVIGGGGILLLEKKEPNAAGITDEQLVEGGVFFVFEPAINLEVSIVKTIKIGMGAGYRFIFKSELERFSDKDLSAPSFNLTFKFGIF
ncbi:MAG: hypothetical protein JXB00_18380 [Bacteroidales bacterium]|nr:hypothetical protein [Bacteroidales bacterium]